ncbi:hypothetical protein BDW02DRAFT_576475 [Decorospora gaudefroyi]|uniref:Uncharacterized protein n=1 Tax=Decorospora gaudefroyi TaxID=184978 RepID=A0A6A5KUG4_9PLEO|nr:hypothetical protein BDW02DRAFT_576475 [Decorospora gaudefroyi]
MSPGLGKVFKRLQVALLICEIPVLGFVLVVCYSLWRHNLFGEVVPYAIQLCSLLSWSTGAMGLLMLGGNPRVEIEDRVNNIPEHINAKLFEPPESPSITANSGTHARHGKRIADADDNIILEFGFLQGAAFQPVAGNCKLSFDEVCSICGLNIMLKRPWQWKLGMAWYASHLLASIILQIASTTTATIGSQSMGVIILILTSVFRGMGVAGPEEWMIPDWAMREGAGYALAMQGKTYSRT